MQDGPRILIDWEPRGRGFLQAIAPAFSRSKRRISVELHSARRPLRPILLSYLLHAAIVFALMTSVRDGWRTPDFVAPIEFHPEHYEIVYTPPNSLPQMIDAGGATSGSSGTQGGAALRTPEQTIRIVRGNLVMPHVVDAPKLQLPHTETPANLLMSSAPAPSVPINAIQHERIMTVQAFTPTPAVVPPPQIVREPVKVDPVLPLPPVPPPVSVPVHEAVIGSHIDLPVPVAPPPDKHLEAATLPPMRAGIPPPDLKEVEVGSIASPTKDSAVVISSQPGTSVGKPNSGSPGAIAMSSTGAGKPGVAEGVGSGAAHGTDAGAAATGNGTGTAATNGAGMGESGVRAGISPGRGPGGSGHGALVGGIAGVTISGGKVMIPSFGASAAVKAGSARMPKENRNMRPITVVATASSGGAVSARGLLKGPKVYTIYIDTTAGLAFLQFAEHVTSAHAGAENAAENSQHDLTVPEPIISKVPNDLQSERVLLAGIMDRNGSLRNLRVVEAGSQDAAHALIGAIEHWHFRPALRDDNPVEVDALFGLNVDTK
jgi:hypothetical protein